MRISIFGMGYVGAITAGCLAREGHQVVGVDINQTKVDLINAGKTPVIEKDIGEIIANTVAEGRLRATTDTADAVHGTEMSLVCVGTPNRRNGSLDLSYVRNVSEEIGRVLAEKDDYHVVVMRSTMLPGSMREVVIPTLERFSGKKAGADFGVCINPEFLREGVAVHDFYHPPKTVIGEIGKRSGDVLEAMWDGLVDAPLIRTDLETAEMVKYTDNVSHALKVAFANEIGNICKRLGIDGHKVMDIYCQDTKLNISPYYLKPGFAFGGSCLPKDVRALTYKARTMDLDVPLLNAIMPSNRNQVQHAIDLIEASGKKKVGVLGLSFKEGTDDMRESPVVDLIEYLLGKGYDLRIYDRNVNLASVVGANKDFIHNSIPHIYELLCESMEEVVDHADTLVIGNGDREFAQALERDDAVEKIIDLVRIDPAARSNGRYEGICW